jgi:hypothetical protein
LVSEFLKMLSIWNEKVFSKLMRAILYYKY